MKPPDALKALSPDALGALESAGMSRRNFIKGSGALIISFSMGGMAARLGAAWDTLKSATGGGANSEPVHQLRVATRRAYETFSLIGPNFIGDRKRSPGRAIITTNR